MKTKIYYDIVAIFITAHYNNTVSFIQTISNKIRPRKILRLIYERLKFKLRPTQQKKVPDKLCIRLKGLDKSSKSQQQNITSFKVKYLNEV